MALSRIGHRNQRGLTLIELMLVLMIIAILTTIANVLIKDFLSRARDNARKRSLQVISRAMQLYFVDNQSYVLNGGGYQGVGTGWFDLEGYPPDYLVSASSVLHSRGLLQRKLIQDPLDVLRPNILIYYCGITYGKTYFMAVTLERPTAAEVATLDAVAAAPNCGGAAMKTYLQTLNKNYAMLWTNS